MADLENMFARLIVGDIIHASCTNGASLICLIESIDDAAIFCRTVTHQIKVVFDRGTGLQRGVECEGQCKIDSIAPLPVDIHNVILGMDRKLRLEVDLKKHRLNDDERSALIFVARYYPANPL